MKSTRMPGRILLALVLVAAIYLTSWYSYVLFHSITEVFSVIVMLSTFTLAWNTRHWMQNDYFLFIGIAFFCVGVIDFLHTLTFKGMNIFAGYDANLPTQLWTLARYLQSLTLLLAPFWIRRRLRPLPTLLAFLGVSSLAVGLVFAGKFPICYVEGAGPTHFKVVSEYVIIVFLVASLVILLRKRDNFEPRVLSRLSLFVILTICAELAFTSYVGVYDTANLIGHLLKLVSALLLYGALIRTGLQNPFELVFRDIKQTETALLHSEADLQKLFDINPFPVIITRRSDASFVKLNQAAMTAFELSAEDISIFTGLDFYANPEERQNILRQLQEHGRVQNELIELKTKSGKQVWYLTNIILIEYEGESCLLVGMADMTEQKRIQEDLQYLSTHDVLTGVYNRTYFEAELNRLRNGRRFPVSVIMLDTDNLKLVNDTYGHAQGDQLLKTVTNQIREVLRSEEVFARIGGDEFALLLPGVDKDTALQVLARIQGQMEKQSGPNGANGHVNISIGLGVANQKEELDEALKQADADMYVNKNTKKGSAGSPPSLPAS